MSHLANEMVMDRTSLASTRKRLVARGRITILPGADQRMPMEALTERGRMALTTTLPYWQHAQAQMADGSGLRAHQTVLSAVRSTIHRSNTS